MRDVVWLDNFVNTLSSLKAHLKAFWRENSEIKRAAIVSCDNVLQRSKIGMAWRGAIIRIGLE